MGSNQVGSVFPGYAGYMPIGIVNGTDLPPSGGDLVFSDGFESGSAGQWTSSTL